MAEIKDSWIAIHLITKRQNYWSQQKKGNNKQKGKAELEELINIHINTNPRMRKGKKLTDDRKKMIITKFPVTEIYKST